MIIIDDIRIKDNYVHNLPENRDLLRYARENRRAGNMAEIAFWKQVHEKMFHGLDFDRQKVIGNYIVDFFVKRLALVIEIDGGAHNEKAEYDAQRDKYLEGLGLKVFHTTDFDVIQHVNIVLADLRKYIVENYEHEDYEKKGIRMPVLLPRPSGTPSKTEGEFARPAQCAVAGNSVQTRVLTSPTRRHWQQKAFF